MERIFYATFLSIPFYFLWNHFAPTYFYWLPQLYLHFTFWQGMGLLVLLSILGAVVFPGTSFHGKYWYGKHWHH